MNDFATELCAQTELLVDSADNAARIADLLPQHWQGRAARSATTRARTDWETARRIGHAIDELGDHYTRFGTHLADIRATLLNLIDEAVDEGMAVTDNGTVTSTSDPDHAAFLQHRIRAQINAFVDTEHQAAKALDSTLTELTTAAPHLASSALPTDPAQLHHAWQQLSTDQKEALYAQDRFLGNRDGIPQAERDIFNRRTLELLRADCTAAQATVDQLTAAHPDWAAGRNIPMDPPPSATHHWKQTHADFVLWRNRIDAARARTRNIDGYDAVARAAQPPRLLTLLDNNGHAAVATNDPDTATHVVTFVPGTGATLTDFDRGMTRAIAMQDKAVALGSGQPAVIAWYGYDAPQSLVTDSPSHAYADRAAPALDRFQEGLRATHIGQPSMNTVVGHSYGTTVIGHAASNGYALNADRLILVASPGVGVDNVADLRLTGVDPAQNGTRVFATTNKFDPIRASPPFIHETQPIRPEFGATVFDGAPTRGPWWSPGGIVWDGSGSHSSYWDPDNPALHTIARIIVGQH
ncbi:alpha/beta hydrolase [Skermania sp. ID1734]|uniref:alpha/beta hydrolase n=1 Tax=Skermania sp. ID1734 TaxID=2597516 RepID=UPI00163D4F3B|nr:alpha/beta hydrolase [Skermania sp. ID1734]